ncbi:MAG: ABC transporter permease [Gemmatimonadaceae bacterium]
MRNLRLAIRMLVKTPLVTAIAVLSLALGIGANAGIYSLFNQLLLSPLPVTAPGDLVNLSAPGPMQGSNSCNMSGSCENVFSYAMFRDLEQKQQALTGIAAHRIFEASMSIRNEPMVGQASMVSGSYFPVLELNPAAGRLLNPDDDRVLGANFVAVISHEFWENKFGRDPAVVGKTMLINGKSFTIVGVAPEKFNGTTAGTRPVVFVPISMRGELQGFTRWEDRRNYWVYLFGRLKPGIQIDAASANLNAVYHPIITDLEAPLQETMSDRTMEQFKAKRVVLEPGPRGQSSVDREARTPLMLLFAVTGIVLLIACANIANLLLARGASRATEMGVRLSLGATRRHLVVQLLTESLVLALLGGIASLLVAQWTLSGMRSIMPAEVAGTMDFNLNGPVIVFAGLLAVGTGMVFGLFPALHSTRSDLITAIRAGANQITGGRAATRFRTVLVTAQIALSTCLLIVSALFLKSLFNISRADLGVKVEQVATFGISPTRAGYDTTRAAVLFNRVAEELRVLPGIVTVTQGRVAVLAGNNWNNSVHVQGFDCGPDVDCNASFNAIGTDYFSTFQVPLLAGREFTAADKVGSERVAIVNEAFARKFRLGTDVVGKFMGEGDDSLNVQIVGLVRDTKYSQVKDSVPPVFYRPRAQDGGIGSLSFYVRSSLPPEQVLGSLRETMHRVDPTLPIEDLKTMTQQVKENVFVDRLISILSATFALVATLLAGIGLYGMLGYSVQQRTRELGIRMALGAPPAGMRSLVMRQVARMFLVGAIIGAAGAVALGRAARSMLYQLDGYDPVAFVLAVSLLGLVAVVAGYPPARRAARVDPMLALRAD